MAIPASKLVKVTARNISGQAGELNFAGLFLTNSSQAQAETLLKFTSVSEVARYFGYDSSEYLSATSYFNGYNNSLTKPTACFFYRHLKKDAAAFVRGQPTSDESDLLQSLQQVSSGDLLLDFGSYVYEFKDLNFTKAKSLSDVAQILQDAINDVGETAESVILEDWANTKVEYSSLTKAFQITAGEAAPEIDFNVISGAVADIIGWSDVTNPIKSTGAKACTYTETLDKVTTLTRNFMTYTTVNEITNLEEAQALAQWANTSFNAGSQFLYVFFTTDSSLDATNKSLNNSTVGKARVGTTKVVNSKSGREIAELFISKAYQGVCGVYGDVRYAAFIMGITASLDWQAPNSTITYAFKAQSGLEANVTDSKTADTLDSLKLNYIGEFATRNESFTLSYQGAMYGSFNWIDSYINSAWLNNALQVALMKGFRNNGRVPYNATGYAQIRSWCMPVLVQAIENAVINVGVDIDDATRNQLETEAASSDISTNLEDNGYFLKIEGDAAARAGRTSPTCHLWYTDAGSVHQLNFTTTTVQ